MVCKMCCWRAEKSGHGGGKFVEGCTNHQLSVVKDHHTSGPHDAAVKAKEDVDARKSDSAISKGLQKMNDKDRDTVTKLREIAFYIALHGLPFTIFEHQINLKKLHDVHYTGAYEHNNACKDFIIYF